MDLKQEFLRALNSGESHDALLDLVRRHQALGLTARQSYDVLHQIWLDFGFDDSDKEGALRNNLEYVLEKVWYQGGLTKSRAGD
jgi:hypothetical protein